MKTSFNTSVNLSLSNQANSSDAGALLVREVLENSQVMNFLADHLTDSRDPVRIVHSLTSQMRTVILQRALGWFDQSDTQVLAGDPLWHLACSDARGLTPLEEKDIHYLGRLKGNSRLQKLAQPYLKRPVDTLFKHKLFCALH